MHSRPLRPLFVLMLCLLTSGLWHACAAMASDLPGAGGLPSAPTPSVPDSAAKSDASSVTLLSHSDRVTIIPRLDVAPKLDDFLTSPEHSQAAKEMLRISHFIERYPNDGGSRTSSTVAYLGY